MADGYCLLHLKVVPRASRARIVGWRPDGRLGIRVTAPPEGGRANGAALELLARALGVPRRSLELMSGANARLKTVRVSGLTEVEVRSRLSHDSQEAAL